MNDTIKHLPNGDFEVIRKGAYNTATIKVTDAEKLIEASSKNSSKLPKSNTFIEKILKWIKQPTLKETKW
jgi:hypothetical protein